MCLVISVTSDSLSNAASSMPPICRVQMPDFVKRGRQTLVKRENTQLSFWALYG
jgi:hypothetical protein